jgi:hypothetical protein
LIEKWNYTCALTGSGTVSCAAGTVSSGSSVTLRQTSASQPHTKTSTTLSAGPNSARFDVTTRSPSLTLILMLLLD